MTVSSKTKSLAEETIRTEEASRRHLVVVLSGAHAFGFSSPDSDLELKGVHVAPTESMLGLHPRSAAAESIRVVDGLEVDYSSNEIGGILLGVLKGNGNYLERLLCPLVLQGSVEHDELKAIVQKSLSRRSYRHYRGAAWQQRKELQTREAPTLDKLLRVLRTTLTGVHLLRTGELIVDLTHNAEEHGYIDALELIEAKRSGEHSVASQSQADGWMSRLDGLFESLDDAVISSPLPHESPNEADLEDWLLRIRLRELERRSSLTFSDPQ